MYDLELDKIVETIKEQNAKQVLIQMPDGLKTEAGKVVEHIEENTDAEVLIWLGSCFGACDLPLGLDILRIDLTVQFGHSRFWKKEW